MVDISHKQAYSRQSRPLATVQLASRFFPESRMRLSILLASLLLAVPLDGIAAHLAGTNRASTAAASSQWKSRVGKSQSLIFCISFS